MDHRSRIVTGTPQSLARRFTRGVLGGAMCITLGAGLGGIGSVLPAGAVPPTAPLPTPIHRTPPPPNARPTHAHGVISRTGCTTPPLPLPSGVTTCR